MIRILVVDDEQLAVQSTVKLIMTELPFVEVQSARDAFEAFKRIDETPFDIILMDICMPGLDGLSAIREIRKKLPDVRVIILSAYNRFTFAQTAVSLGVDEYLLKPLVHDRFLPLIRRLIDEIQLSEKEHVGRLEQREKIRQLQAYVRKELFERILSGAEFADGEDAECLRVLGITLAGSRILMIRYEQDGQGGQDQILPMVRKNAERLFDGIAQIVAPDQVVVLMNSGALPADEAELIIEKRARYLMELTNTQQAKALRVGVGCVSPDARQIAHSCRQAEWALRSCAAGQVAFFERDSESATFSRPVFALETIAEALFEGDCQWLQGDILAMLDACYDAELRDGVNAKLRVLELLFELNLRIGEIDRGFFEDCHGEQVRLLQAVMQANSENGVRKSVDDYRAFLERRMGDAGRHAGKTAVGRALSFIAKHFHQELTLEQVADHVGVSQYHLSRVFKAETGSGFLNYLTDLRINTARQLLQKGELSVKEVALRVGYPNQGYFGKIFREKVGVTPGEYRSQGMDDV